MTPIGQMTIGEAIASLRDISFICGTVYLGWKIRSWLQPLFDFFREASSFFRIARIHMTQMEMGMDTLLGNHLHHIQADLGHISGRERRNPLDIQTVAEETNSVGSIADATGNSDSVEV
jgi:hypothetical protein